MSLRFLRVTCSVLYVSALQTPHKGYTVARLPPPTWDDLTPMHRPSAPVTERRRAYLRATRALIGEEVCPKATEVREQLNKVMQRTQSTADRKLLRAAIVSVEQITSTTHKLRTELVNFMVVASDPGLLTCPNCRRSLWIYNEHHPKCLVRKVLASADLETPRA